MNKWQIALFLSQFIVLGMARSQYVDIRSKRMSKAKWLIFPPAIAVLSGANAWLQYNLYAGQSKALFAFAFVLTGLACACTYQSGSKGGRAAFWAYLCESISIFIMIGSCAFTWDAQRQISSGREMADELAKGAKENQGFVNQGNEVRLAELNAYNTKLQAFNQCVGDFNRLPVWSREKRNGMTVAKKCDWMKPKESESAPSPSIDLSKLDIDPNKGRHELQMYLNQTNRYFMIFQVIEMAVLFFGIIMSTFFEGKTVRRRKMPTRSFNRQITSSPSPLRTDASDRIQ